MLIRIIVTAGLVFGFVGVTQADTRDQKRFEKSIAKHAVEVDDAFEKLKPKASCVCNGPSFLTDRPGFVVRRSNGRIECGLPLFSQDGSMSSFEICTDWEALRR